MEPLPPHVRRAIDNVYLGPPYFEIHDSGWSVIFGVAMFVLFMSLVYLKFA